MRPEVTGFRNEKVMCDFDGDSCHRGSGFKREQEERNLGEENRSECLIKKYVSHVYNFRGS